MGTAFWIRRFLLVWVFALVLIGGAQALKGHPLRYALGQGLFWATVSAGVFTGSRFYRSRQGQACALCKDTPEMPSTPQGPTA